MKLTTCSRLIHYTDSKELDLTRTYTQPRRDGVRPNGLWLGFGEVWKKYARINSWDEIAGMNSSIFQVWVDPKCLLVINHPDDMPKKYGYDRWAYPRRNMPDYPAMSNDYCGIAFPNFKKDYQDPLWYRAIDVPSICVWNLRAITKVSYLRRDME